MFFERSFNEHLSFFPDLLPALCSFLRGRGTVESLHKIFPFSVRVYLRLYCLWVQVCLGFLSQNLVKT